MREGHQPLDRDPGRRWCACRRIGGAGRGAQAHAEAVRGAMPGSRLGAGRRPGFLAGGFALLIVLLASLAQPPRAFAHAALVGSQPPDGVTLADSPATLKLTFNEPVSPLVVRLL